MELLKPEETAARLGVSVGTLAVWRCERRYPLRYVRVGRRIRYEVQAIEEFVQRRSVSGDGSDRPRCRRRSRKAA
jgi:predicted site-specific integrase-resolvase